MNCYLCLNDGRVEYVGYPSLSAAKRAYTLVAEDLGRFGQVIEATIHLANTESEVAEYPDFVLSIGPRGGLKIEST